MKKILTNNTAQRLYSFLLTLGARASVIFLLLSISIASAQAMQPDSTNVPLLQEEELQVYLQASDHLESLIQQLKEEAEVKQSHGDIAGFIKKIQLGLLLAKRMPKPTREVFDLYAYAGFITSTIDPHYGLEFFKKACETISQTEGIPYSDIFSVYTTRAGLHATLAEQDSALFYFRKAITASRMESPVSEASANNNLGVFYFENEQYDSAAVCFQKALILIGDNREVMALYCAILDNLAQLELHHQHPLVARKTFLYNDSVYIAHGLHNKYLPNRIRLMKVMHQLGIKGIEEMIQSLTAYYPTHIRDIPSKEITAYLRFVIDYYYDIGKPELVKPYQDKYFHWTDSLHSATTEQVHLLTQSLFAVEEASFENEIRAQQLVTEQSRMKLKSARWTLLLSLFSAAVIITLLVLYFRTRRQELRAQKQIAETELKNKEIETRLMEQELALKKKDLTTIVLHNTQVHDANQKLIDRLHSMSRNKESLEQGIHALLVELQSQNQLGERSMSLQANIDEVNEAFYENLRSRFPDLTKAESELCGYLRINLSTKDISILKNVEATSVKMGKNRLRKKLGIGMEADLYDFVREI